MGARRVSGVLVALLVFLALGGQIVAQGVGYRLGAWTAGASAGGSAAADAYAVRGTLGQGSVWTSSGGGVFVSGGIWPGRAVQPAPPGHRVYLPLAQRAYPQTHPVADAPDTCPGMDIEKDGHYYRENMDRANDNDWYTFQARAGAVYTIRATDLGSRADTVLYLYSGCTALLAQNDDCVEGNPLSGSCIEGWVAPADGAYNILVRHYDWRVYGAGTEYTLGVSEAR